MDFNYQPQQYNTWIIWSFHWRSFHFHFLVSTIFLVILYPKVKGILIGQSDLFCFLWYLQMLLYEIVTINRLLESQRFSIYWGDFSSFIYQKFSNFFSHCHYFKMIIDLTKLIFQHIFLKLFRLILNSDFPLLNQWHSNF